MDPSMAAAQGMPPGAPPMPPGAPPPMDPSMMQGAPPMPPGAPPMDPAMMQALMGGAGAPPPIPPGAPPTDPNAPPAGAPPISQQDIAGLMEAMGHKPDSRRVSNAELMDKLEDIANKLEALMPQPGPDQTGAMLPGMPPDVQAAPADPAAIQQALMSAGMGGPKIASRKGSLQPLVSKLKQNR